MPVIGINAFRLEPESIDEVTITIHDFDLCIRCYRPVIVVVLNNLIITIATHDVITLFETIK